MLQEKSQNVIKVNKIQQLMAKYRCKGTKMVLKSLYGNIQSSARLNLFNFGFCKTFIPFLNKIFFLLPESSMEHCYHHSQIQNLVSQFLPQFQ